MHRAGTSANVYQGNITVASTAVGTDGVRFGESGGSGTLGAGFTITTGAGGFVSGILTLNRLTQNGGTAQAITLTGTSLLTLANSSFSGTVNFSSPRMITSGTSYQNVTTLEKTGGTNDISNGSNVFFTNFTMNNSGSGWFLMGNGAPDIYLGNVDINNSGSSITYLADNSIGNTISGNLTMNLTGAMTGAFLSRIVNSTLAISGNLSVTTSSSADQTISIPSAGSVTVGGTLTVANNSTANNVNIYVTNEATGSANITGTATVTNSGSNTATQRIFLGESGDVVFAGNLNIVNNSTATNSEVFLNRNSTSNNNYNGNITVQSTATGCDGVLFGSEGGSGTLAASRTVTIGGGGFVDGSLLFRNFTQVGATAQTLVATGGTTFTSEDSNWGGNVVFTSPRITTEGTTYSGTVAMTKTGANDDNSAGGNTFNGATTLTNSGSGLMAMGNGSPDNFQDNLSITNSGSDDFALGLNSAGNTIAGNLDYVQSGTSGNGIFSSTIASSLMVTGTASFTNNSAGAVNGIQVGENGDITFGSTLSLINNSSGATSNNFVANGTESTVTITGATTLENNGTGATTQRIFLGQNGDVTCNGTLTMTNTSGATTSNIFCNHNATSNNAYNQNIVVSTTNASSDGIFFGNGGGAGTLAASRTITIGAGGFTAGSLSFRNFTQTGATAQTLDVTGTSTLQITDSDWGGNVNFSGTRIQTQGTLYRGTADLEKSGGIGDDSSLGGNTFTGNATIRNTGSAFFLLGGGTADAFNGNLEVLNTGSDEIFLAHNSIGNTVAGTLTVTQSNTAIGVEFCNNMNSTLVVTGNTVANNNSSNNNSRIYIGNAGDVTFNGTVALTNAGSGTNSDVSVGVASNSQIIFNDVATITNNATSSGTGRMYLGDAGDVTFNAALSLINSSSAGNSEIFLNDDPTSLNAYNSSILVASTNASSDGIQFGVSGGSGTLASGQAVAVSGSGFIAGDLRFSNFTQTGTTVQTLTATGTARIYNSDSNWGGTTTFTAPRIYTEGTTYNSTSFLTKTGGTTDQSPGGNLFVGASTLTHTGSDSFIMGDGTADSWGNNLTVLNNGSGGLNIAHAGAGHNIAGTLNWTHGSTSTQDNLATESTATLTVQGMATITNQSSNAAATIFVANEGSVTFNTAAVLTNNALAGTGQIRISENSTSSATFTGAATFLNAGAATTASIFVGVSGDVTFSSTVDFANSGSSTNGFIFVANGANSAISITGRTRIFQSGANSTNRCFIGSDGDITFNGPVEVFNSSTAANSEVFMNYSSGSFNIYNDDVSVSSVNSNCDGVRFGQNGGAAQLSSGATISAVAPGFSAGDLRFRNFTQLGTTTPQTLTLTGTARMVLQTSEWNSNVTLSAPRFTTTTTTYNRTTSISKTGSNSDNSIGGNTYNGDVTFTNSSTSRMRLASSGGFPDDYNANATFVRTNTGALEPSFNNTDSYAGNININATGQVYFGRGTDGRVLLDGTTTQNINDLGGGSTTPLFRDLQVAKASGTLEVNMAIDIQTELDLDNGIVNTTSANAMTMLDGSTVSSVSDASHVDGPIIKLGNDAFTFPIGDQGFYRPAGISAPAATSARFSGQYIFADAEGTFGSARDASLDHISNCEYWIIDRVAGLNDVQVTLTYDAFDGPCSGVDNAATLLVARWDGSMWRDEGGPGTANVTGSITTPSAVTDFSPFTLSSGDANNPLPVELLNFDAKYNGTDVDVFWATATEINNDFFIVERSQDLQSWTEVTRVNGAGTTTETIQYSTVDEQPFTGVNYYRLKQVDYDGQFEYSNVATVIVPESEDASVLVYPNPATTEIYVSGDAEEINTVALYNAVGQRIDANITLTGDRARIDLNGLASGVYYVQTRTTASKILKQ